MNKIKQVLLWPASILLGSGIMIGCYPGGPDFVEELDVVATIYDTEYAFKNTATYKMPDSVVHIRDDENNADGTFDEQILEEVASNLEAIGYVRLADTVSQTPDVFVTVSTIETTNVEIACLPPWWWGSWGWYPGWPGWGVGWYPGYPGGCAPAYAYSTGTLLVRMLDPAGASEMEIPAVWYAAVNGLLQGSEGNMSARISRGINQAFAQSPYLSGN